MAPEFERRMARAERRGRIGLVAGVAGLVVGLIAVIGAVGSGARAAASTTPRPETTPGVLTVRELNVVDANGVTRVRLGAPLEHAVQNGQRNRSRGGRPEDTVSGMLLFDAEGVERSGYVTVDRGYSNVLMTLDSKTRQHAMFIAEPTGHTTLRLFNADTKDRVDVAIGPDGPHIAMIRRGEEIYRFPPK